MTEEEAARYVRAALRLMIERVPEGSALWRGLQSTRDDLEMVYFGTCSCPRDQQVYCHAENCQGGADLLDPPWATEPATEPVPVPWSQVVEGDWARGGDGVFYLVKGNRAENGRAYVTIQVRGKDNTYPREPGAEVLVKRGPVGLAVDTLAAAGLGPEVLESA